MKRVFLLAMIVSTGLSLSGCTHCGPIWNDWFHTKSCVSDSH